MRRRLFDRPSAPLDPARQRWAQSLLGAEAQWTTALGRTPLMLEGRLGWAHEFQSSSPTLSGTYAGDASRTVLTQTLQPLGANDVRAGLAAVFGLDERATLRLGYDGSYAADMASHSLSFRISAAW